jgi:hypothetical protein
MKTGMLLIPCIIILIISATEQKLLLACKEYEDDTRQISGRAMASS